MVSDRDHEDILRSWRRKGKKVKSREREKILRQEKEEKEDMYEVGEREMMNFLIV